MGCRSIYDHFPEDAEGHIDRYSGWRLTADSLVTARWFMDKRCAEVRSSMKLCRSGLGKAEQEVKGSRELRRMSAATPLLKNQQGFSST